MTVYSTDFPHEKKSFLRNVIQECYSGFYGEKSKISLCIQNSLISFKRFLSGTKLAWDVLCYIIHLFFVITLISQGKEL